MSVCVCVTVSSLRPHTHTRVYVSAMSLGVSEFESVYKRPCVCVGNGLPVLGIPLIDVGARCRFYEAE